MTLTSAIRWRRRARSHPSVTVLASAAIARTAPSTF